MEFDGNQQMCKRSDGELNGSSDTSRHLHDGYGKSKSSFTNEGETQNHNRSDLVAFA